MSSSALAIPYLQSGPQSLKHGTGTGYTHQSESPRRNPMAANLSFTVGRAFIITLISVLAVAWLFPVSPAMAEIYESG